MNLKDLTSHLESWAPLKHAESFDNVGLLIGNPNKEVTKAIVCLDVTKEVIEEAILKEADLIISFHPLIFSGLKRINNSTRTEKCVTSLIKNDIALYAIHTNLDNQLDGVNKAMGDALGLLNKEILIPKEASLYQLAFFVPTEYSNAVQMAIFKCGGGAIGNYKDCSFNSIGEGTFTPKENAKPRIGEIQKKEFVQEQRVEILIEESNLSKAIEAMKKAHPYEEVAYNIIELKNKNQDLGMGQLGELPKALKEEEFLSYLKRSLPTDCIRHSPLLDKPIKKLAILGGSGAFAIENAISAGADCLVTSDLKYHDFFKAESRILLCDVGHFESEQFTIKLIADKISKKFPNFVVLKTEIQTNPVNYF